MSCSSILSYLYVAVDIGKIGDIWGVQLFRGDRLATLVAEASLRTQFQI